MAQISSRGASRAFIVAVFQRALDWAIKETAKGEAITFPYPTAVVADWLAKAKDDCDRDPSPYGGTPFDCTSFFHLFASPTVSFPPHPLPFPFPAHSLGPLDPLDQDRALLHVV